MKAIQVKQAGGPEVMTLVDLPVPKPNANEALVKITVAGVNFVDVYIREGRYRSPLPLIVGQEAAGVVTEVGANVTQVKPGDRVAYRGIPGVMPSLPPCLSANWSAFPRVSTTGKPPPPCCRE